MVDISEPQDEFFGRNSLYGIGGMILRSAMYNHDPKRRSLCAEAMQKLVNIVSIVLILYRIREAAEV
ncbi:hypothetical protein V2G26_012767 [Clonostachys chloroleuca]